MLTPDEIRIKTLRHWSSGRMLRAVIEDKDFFPLSIPWGRPSAKQIREDFSATRKRINELVAQSGPENMGYTIDWRAINHRRLGRQRVPAAVLFDLPGFLHCTDKRKEYNQFLADLALFRTREPRLEGWLTNHPMDIVRQAEKWPRLLAVLDYFKAHPCPDLYLRQLDIPGVDSKFIELHKKILNTLLDNVLPEMGINSASTGLAQHGFERRYGLRYDEPPIRMRYLDRNQAPHPACCDITFPLSGFTSLQPPCSKVIVTENKINGLCFPPLADALIIFGLGYGIEALKHVPWLRNKTIFYWGDIDTHGFSILSLVRSFLPQTQSFLMDRETLHAHRSLWGQEEESRRCTARLNHLTTSELSLYNDLTDNILGCRIRLEQERITFSMVETTAHRLTSNPTWK